MHVLLLHLDGKLPNLALMRLHAYHRALGDTVELRKCCDADGYADATMVEPWLGDPAWGRVYASLIFERTKPVAERVRWLYPEAELGGTGWDFDGGVPIRKTDLPEIVTTYDPDYTGYPDFEYSIGFTQRGCRLKCDHCVVPWKEGRVRPSAPLENILNSGRSRTKAILLDNDFFGNPLWRDVIAYAREHDVALAVVQGIAASSATLGTVASDRTPS